MMYENKDKMTRCSQKTAKGLRCKSHGAEHNGVIICAVHLKEFHDMPMLIPIDNPAPLVTPPCTHKDKCDLTHEKCCECSDTRPIQDAGYVAYLNPSLADAVLVSRDYYYCPSCKTKETFDTVLSEMLRIIYPDDTARYYVSNLRKTHHVLVKLFNDGISDCKTSETNWNFHVYDTLDHILSTRLAGMPEDETTWTGKDAQLNTLMNKLTMIHKSMLIKPAPANPDRPETLSAAYERIDELQKKISEMEPQLAAAKEKAKSTALISLWNSGCEDMCYHLGFCSDIMSDCWEPVYEKDGLEGLKANLRDESKHHHHGKACEECKKCIESLHD
jgi:hypothetical protein